jgi:hypothetical protein
MPRHSTAIDNVRTQELALHQRECQHLMDALRQAELDDDDTIWWYLRRALNDRIRLARERLGYPLHDPAWQVPWNRDQG